MLKMSFLFPDRPYQLVSRVVSAILLKQVACRNAKLHFEVTSLLSSSSASFKLPVKPGRTGRVTGSLTSVDSLRKSGRRSGHQLGPSPVRSCNVSLDLNRTVEFSWKILHFLSSYNPIFQCFWYNCLRSIKCILKCEKLALK